MTDKKKGDLKTSKQLLPYLCKIQQEGKDCLSDLEYCREKGVRYHCGIDLAFERPGNPGKIVVATEKGEVVNLYPFTGKRTKMTYLNDTYCLLIQHDSGRVVNYAEIQKAYVKIGDTVSVGDRIAEIGRVGKGKNDSSMLHFELWEKGTKKNEGWPVEKEKPPTGLKNPKEYLSNCTHKTLEECEELVKKAESATSQKSSASEQSVSIWPIPECGPDERKKHIMNGFKGIRCKIRNQREKQAASKKSAAPA